MTHVHYLADYEPNGEACFYGFDTFCIFSGPALKTLEGNFYKDVFIAFSAAGRRPAPAACWLPLVRAPQPQRAFWCCAKRKTAKSRKNFYGFCLKMTGCSNTAKASAFAVFAFSACTCYAFFKIL